MRDRWIALCRRIGGGGDAEALFILLEGLYANPPRAYHNLGHIAACLGVLDRHRGLATDPDSVEFALWLHDCVYEPMRKDNEERSARTAALFARELHAPAGFADALASLIDATRHTGAALACDAALVADIDMSILASPAAEYDAYAGAIRREYALVPDAEYRAGRAAFLQGLLGGRAIFHTAMLKSMSEAAARENIARELLTLRTS